MKIGDLVKNLRASIGIPKGTVGLVISKDEARWADNTGVVYRVQWLKAPMRIRPRLEMDLEVI